MKTCVKCGYVRRATDTGPDYACPACGVVYAKAEAAAAVTKARIESVAAAAARKPAVPVDDAKARADALIRQFAITQAKGERKPSPYRGMALVALVAFSVGFASAAGLYSSAGKFAKKAAADKCVKSAGLAPSPSGRGVG
jgi:hypothetical protein